MSEYFKNLFSKNPKVRKAVGALLLLVGIFALLTPFTPGSWLIFVGLGLLGVHFLSWDRVKSLLQKQKDK